MVLAAALAPATRVHRRGPDADAHAHGARPRAATGCCASAPCSRHGADAGDSAAQTAAVNAAVREIDAAGGRNGAPVEVINRNGGTAGDGVGRGGVRRSGRPRRGRDHRPVVGGARGDRAPLAAAGGHPAGLGIGGRRRPGRSEGWYCRSIPCPAPAQGESAGRRMIGDGSSDHAARRCAATTSTGLADGLTAARATRRRRRAPIGDRSARPMRRSSPTRDPDAVVIVDRRRRRRDAALIAALAAAGVAGDAHLDRGTRHSPATRRWRRSGGRARASRPASAPTGVRRAGAPGGPRRAQPALRARRRTTPRCSSRCRGARPVTTAGASIAATLPRRRRRHPVHQLR